MKTNDVPNTSINNITNGKSVRATIPTTYPKSLYYSMGECKVNMHLTLVMPISCHTLYTFFYGTVFFLFLMQKFYANTCATISDSHTQEKRNHLK